MKTIQNMMKTISTLLLCMLTSLLYAANEEQQLNAYVSCNVSWSTDGQIPEAMIHEGKGIQCQPFRMKKATEEEHKFTWMEVTTTHGGELAELLGDKNTKIDSLVVNGPINAADFKTLFRSSLYGYLSVINLKEAIIENNEIPDYAFFDRDEQFVDDEKNGMTFYYIVLRRIILPEGLKRIGNNAFFSTLALEDVQLPSTLREIGEAAFINSRIKMNPLIIPEGMSTIAPSTFSFCSHLIGQVVLPSTMKEIQREAFYNTPITAINFPEGLEKIGETAFQGCRLKEVSIPNSCLDFGRADIAWTFADNFYLEKIRLPEEMTEIPSGFLYNALKLREISIPHTVKNLEWRALSQCFSIKRLEFPLGVQSIGEEALEFMDSLECVVFPASMKSLGALSCGHWDNIKEIYCAAMEPPVCDPKGGGPFEGYKFPHGTLTPIVYIPTGTMDKYFDKTQNGAGWGGFWNFVEIDPSEFPATAIATPAITENHADKTENHIYDLQGRRVTTPQKGHIYVSKGRKFVF